MTRKAVRIAAIVSVIAVAITYHFYLRLTGGSSLIPDGAEPVFVEIPRGTSLDQLIHQLDAKGLLPDSTAFMSVAEQLNYGGEPLRSGRFAVLPGMSMKQMINLLKKGKQSPVRVILTTEREPRNVAAKAARFLATDSASIQELLTDSIFLDSIGYSRENLMSLFIPNTYEFFWDARPREFIARMQKEHALFWQKKDRQHKAQRLKLSPEEVYTLASIIEKETLRDDEKRRMAGVYYNRIQKSMLLQADPTAVYASRDFNTNRVTNYHLKTDSPYNTYMYKGLPPGPIAMASISSIDAVLNLEIHDYIFFCAKGDGSGYHNFAKTLAAHNQNAAAYRENRRRRGR